MSSLCSSFAIIWSTLCETNPVDAPVVLWLQGGPGGSSLFALFAENGRFRVDATGKTLKLNPNSWNRVVDNIRQLINKYDLQRMTVYNGDFDMVCDFIDDQRFVDKLGFQRNGNYKYWTVDGKPDGIIGGYVERYEKVAVNNKNNNNEDEIIALPGLKYKINFKQYSGYLNIPDGKHLFYWFVESQTNPATAPVVLWLQGGPCSSALFGLLAENGPFHVDADGKSLHLNPYSWNSVANMLYIEAPVDAGFSYKDDKKYLNNDTTVATDNRLALVEFFKKYPNLQKNPFYIKLWRGLRTNVLAFVTVDYRVGIFLGNQSMYDMLVGSGQLSIESYERKIEACCQCAADGHTVRECDFSKPVNATKCNQAQLELGSVPNAYNIYDDCGGLDDDYLSAMFDRYYRSRFEALGIVTMQAHQQQHIVANKLNCPKNGYTDYLNTPAGLTPQHDNIRDLIEKYGLKRVTVYNGNFDLICDFIDDQRFVEALGYQNGVIGGYIERYEKGLQFVLVRGAGHMVPKDKPEAAFQVFKDLIGIEKL
ncbi:serine carboxypeptidase ctsa-1.2-like [Oppia nitens]|uniref:serine carboxypeptidase ctsa-1.2-like n=1 Tax=Oppia nitens TaxID=1686743 RepID=UPI0023DAFBA3|nr:serine carboxypeptidase ctsa-1.2-like [Oppia nitens]